MSIFKRFSVKLPSEPGVEIIPINGLALSNVMNDTFFAVSIINVNNLSTNLVEGFLELRLYKHNIPTYNVIYLTEDQYNWTMRQFNNSNFYKLKCPFATINRSEERRVGK